MRRLLTSSNYRYGKKKRNGKWPIVFKSRSRFFSSERQYARKTHRAFSDGFD